MAFFAAWSILGAPAQVALWGPMVAYVGLAAVTAVLTHRRLVPRAWDRVQIVMDALLITIALWAFGTMYTPYVVLYLPLVVSCALQRGKVSGLVALSSSLLLYGGLIALEQLGVLTEAPATALLGEAGTPYDGPASYAIVLVVCLVSAYAYLTLAVRRIEQQSEVELELLTSKRAAQEESRRLQGQLEAMQRLESLGRLAGGVAHDFNNLLTGILGYARLLEEHVGADEEARADLAEIVHAGERASSLTAQLLAFSRKQMANPVLVDLGEVTARIRRMLQRIIGEDIEIEVACAPGIGLVHIDPAQIERVIVNLAVNARDAMPDGGRLSLVVDDVDLDQEFCDRHPGSSPGPHVRLAVRDTGSGMDQETQEHIFEPFFTTKERGKGTGLGLATVYGVIKQNGGCIYVSSAPGAGTTIEVFLPRRDGVAHAAGAEVPEATHGRGTILVVEDEEVVRNLTTRIVRQAGYSVLSASSAEEALELAASHSGRIDLLLTDVVMPGRSGLQLAEELCSTRPEIRVLFMSGYTDDSFVRAGLCGPGQEFMEKPFSRDGLLSRVRELLDDHRSARAGATA